MFIIYLTSLVRYAFFKRIFFLLVFIQFYLCEEINVVINKTQMKLETGCRPILLY